MGLFGRRKERAEAQTQALEDAQDWSVEVTEWKGVMLAAGKTPIELDQTPDAREFVAEQLGDEVGGYEVATMTVLDPSGTHPDLMIVCTEEDVALGHIPFEIAAKYAPVLRERDATYHAPVVLQREHATDPWLAVLWIDEPFMLGGERTNFEEDDEEWGNEYEGAEE